MNQRLNEANTWETELGLEKKKIVAITLSQEETRRWSLWLEKRRFVMPSEGGLDSSRPATGGTAAMAV